MRLLIRWVIMIAALIVASWVVPGVRIEGTNAWLAVAVMAVVLGLINAVIRPILAFLSCGCIVLTLGLFVFVVNGICLWLASWISVNWFGVGFYVDGFWPAFFGSIVVSIVSWLISMLLPDEESLLARRGDH